MKYFPLQRKELKLSLNKLLNKNYLWLLISLFIVAGCGNNEDEQSQKIKLPDFNDPQIAAREASKAVGGNVMFAYKGTYDTDTTTEIAAGLEINNAKDWGIKFNLLKYENDSLQSSFTSGLLDGSFSESLVKKINLPSTPYDLLYYNSLDYFLGSGGGEVYSYIVDFNKRQTYYAHLIIERREAISLFLSDNISDQEVKDYFIKTFTTDYPRLKIISNDKELNL